MATAPNRDMIFFDNENGVALELSEIFVSDGAKSDIGNILDLFDKENTVLIVSLSLYSISNILEEDKYH